MPGIKTLCVLLVLIAGFIMFVLSAFYSAAPSLYAYHPVRYSDEEKEPQEDALDAQAYDYISSLDAEKSE